MNVWTCWCVYVEFCCDSFYCPCRMLPCVASVVCQLNSGSGRWGFKVQLPPGLLLWKASHATGWNMGKKEYQCFCVWTVMAATNWCQSWLESHNSCIVWKKCFLWKSTAIKSLADHHHFYGVFKVCKPATSCCSWTDVPLVHKVCYFLGVQHLFIIHQTGEAYYSLCDLAIVGCFKQFYRKHLILKAVCLMHLGKDMKLKMNVLQGMHFRVVTWQ